MAAREAQLRQEIHVLRIEIDESQKTQQVSEITDTDYGSRDFTVRDPEGNLWAFGTYRPQAGDG